MRNLDADEFFENFLISAVAAILGSACSCT
jgi:hypothetical protein